MRRIVGSGVGLIVVLALGGTARAQSTPQRALTVPFANFGAQQVQFQVVDTSKQNPVPIARPQTFNSGVNWSNLIPSFGPRMNNKSVIGLSEFPTPDGMPGRGYLSAFGFSRAQPIK